MQKHILHDIKARLEDFPEERIPDLIDYIETNMQSDEPKIDKQSKTRNQEYFPEAGP